MPAGTFSLYFFHMAGENGSQKFVSLLQYRKDTRLENPRIIVKDERIMELDRIVKGELRCCRQE